MPFISTPIPIDSIRDYIRPPSSKVGGGEEVERIALLQALFA
jgi:hypothetical protein